MVGVEVLQDLTTDSLPGWFPSVKWRSAQCRTVMFELALGMMSSPWLSSPRFQRLPNVDNDPVRHLSNRQKTLQKTKASVSLLDLQRSHVVACSCIGIRRKAQSAGLAQEGVPVLKAMRTDRGLALPSPRFGSALELLRSSSRCRMAPA